MLFFYLFCFYLFNIFKASRSDHFELNDELNIKRNFNVLTLKFLEIVRQVRSLFKVCLISSSST